MATEMLQREMSALGGQGRAASLSPERRKEIAQAAARARWAKAKAKPKEKPAAK